MSSSCFNLRLLPIWFKTGVIKANLDKSFYKRVKIRMIQVQNRTLQTQNLNWNAQSTDHLTIAFTRAKLMNRVVRTLLEVSTSNKLDLIWFACNKIQTLSKIVFYCNLMFKVSHQFIFRNWSKWPKSKKSAVLFVYFTPQNQF